MVAGLVGWGEVRPTKFRRIDALAKGWKHGVLQNGRWGRAFKKIKTAGKNSLETRLQRPEIGTLSVSTQVSTTSEGGLVAGKSLGGRRLVSRATEDG